MEKTIQVTEEMAAFIKWAEEKGLEEVRRILREKLQALKEHDEKAHGTKDEDGFVWDPQLEENDRNDQYHKGGDCNKCKRAKYCSTQCRPNRVLKAISTPILYQVYLSEHPELIAKGIAHSVKAEDVAQMVESESPETKVIRVDDEKIVVE